jgi:hypothetical protein
MVYAVFLYPHTWDYREKYETALQNGWKLVCMPTGLG